jgi:hypothetical protein
MYFGFGGGWEIQSVRNTEKCCSCVYSLQQMSGIIKFILASKTRNET